MGQLSWRAEAVQRDNWDRTARLCTAIANTVPRDEAAQEHEFHPMRTADEWVQPIKTDVKIPSWVAAAHSMPADKRRALMSKMIEENEAAIRERKAADANRD